ncbi:MAG: hypothetical protein JWM80_3614 [Cyanobacteria bacterium RYN_339]|nr:hypothetical protein [Cyanobacteria bacterium RYN_339]
MAIHHPTFTPVARRITDFMGTPLGFGLAVAIALVPFLLGHQAWLVVLPVLRLAALALLRHNELDTSSTIHLKLDELLRAVGRADNQLIAIEADHAAQLDQLKAEAQTAPEPASHLDIHPPKERN